VVRRRASRRNDASAMSGGDSRGGLLGLLEAAVSRWRRPP
jgi:hypothetical protein